jgi:DNA helicase-4
LFHNFEKYFGEHEKLFIENTYRNSQELIDISSSFIQKNPLQIQKKLKSKKTVHTPLYFIKYDKEKLFSVFLQTIENIIKENGKEKEILILGRHKKDIKEILEKDYQNKIKKYDANTNTLVITDYENVNIKFITVHSSKGIESDNVIILNMENNLYGFPNKLTDDPLLSLLLSEKEEYRFAEERRLFYVALTRTKNKVYLFIPKEESLFIEEIKEINNIHKNSIDLLSYHNGKTSVIKCTWCKTGNMVIRKNSKDGKLFLGCSHFPICNQTYNDIEILENTILCPSCESGYLISKSGRYGAFLGCSNFPNCKNTINIR